MTADQSTDHFIRWAKAHASPVDVEAPPDEFRDLNALAAIVGNARVVGFGESQHHVRQFSRMRARLFRFLAERLEFTTFVFECGVVEAKAAHDYVLGLHDDTDAAFVPIESGFSVWREFQDLVHWMRDYNRVAEGQRKLKFYGMDGSRRWMSTRNAVAYVCDYLDRVNPENGKLVREELLPLAEAVSLENAGETPTETIRDLVRGLVDLVGHLQIEQMRYLERSTFEAFDWAHRASLVARQIGSILSAAHRDPENAQLYRWNIRDAGMATELKWILDREGPDARLFLGAHNIHLQKVPANSGRATAGRHLALVLPHDELVMIAGTNNYSLKPDDPAIEGSFQAALAQVGMPSFLLDLRAAGEDKQISAWLNETRADRSNIAFFPINEAQAWDAVFFTERVSIDTLSLPTPFARTYVELEPDRLDGLTGVYDIAGIGGSHVVLRIIRDGDHLLTEGAESDGELFPMYRSELLALSDVHFAWPEWAFEVEFERDAEGSARVLHLRAPQARDRFRGVKRA